MRLPLRTSTSIPPIPAALHCTATPLLLVPTIPAYPNLAHLSASLPSELRYPTLLAERQRSCLAWELRTTFPGLPRDQSLEGEEDKDDTETLDEHGAEEGPEVDAHSTQPERHIIRPIVVMSMMRKKREKRTMKKIAKIAFEIDSGGRKVIEVGDNIVPVPAQRLNLQARQPLGQGLARNAVDDKAAAFLETGAEDTWMAQ
ncbi:hypothetical protein GYMLUDRAFT_243133 [Collybiopsis luxurians FD-317 M1]|uniref:Uncharacterized protein n=1 Tax=Collybiopsis luxurians FD-317 M1 TaxID=944289 RepID=A0A0D0C1L3_9AGAR|nr:hypothetical protein GYMLUDRAFT_243133 [Collybiopsis luxurians FD-317 M1]